LLLRFRANPRSPIAVRGTALEGAQVRVGLGFSLGRHYHNGSACQIKKQCRAKIMRHYIKMVA
jgi:hypothetical protein